MIPAEHLPHIFGPDTIQRLEDIERTEERLKQIHEMQLLKISDPDKYAEVMKPKEMLKKRHLVPDKSSIAAFEKHMNPTSGTHWIRLAHMALHSTIERHGQDGAENYKTEFLERHPDFSDIIGILVHESFIRIIGVSSEDTFPYRITTKGLALHTVLDDILFYIDAPGNSKVEAEVNAYQKKISDLCFKLLHSLNSAKLEAL
jgi:hypothetical protein